MADDSWPSPNHNSRAVTDEEYEKIHVRGTDDGVYGDPTDSAVVVAGVGLNVTIKANRSGHLRGFHWTSGTTDFSKSIAANSSGSTRIDRVVLRLTRGSTWTVRAEIRQGTAGSGLPALVQDTGTGVYEIPLARVTVNNNASAVTVTRDELWVGSRVRPCTSTTRPPNPRRGDEIYETDTDRWMGWNGSAWVVLYDHSGRVPLGAGYSAWDHYGTNYAIRRNGVVYLRLLVKRVADGTWTAADADGTYVASVPSGLRPVTFEHSFAGVFTNNAVCRALVQTDGQIWLKDNTKDVPVGGSLMLSMSYPIEVS